MVERLRSVEKEEYWRWHVDMWAADGLSARAYCRREGLSTCSFYAWRRELRRRDEGGALSASAAKSVVEKQAAAQQTTSKHVAARQTSAIRSAHGLARSDAGAGLVALEIVSDLRAPREAMLEVETTDGMIIRLREEVSLDVLRRVIAACQLSLPVTTSVEAAMHREVRSC